MMTMQEQREETSPALPQSQSKPTTPKTTDWQQMKILCRRNFSKDKQKPMLWMARFLSVAPFVMLYTIGFFIGYPSDYEPDNEIYTSGLKDGDYVIHDAEPWTYPNKMIVNDFDWLSITTNENEVDGYGISTSIQEMAENTVFISWKNETDYADTRNVTAFQEYCDENIVNIYTDVCVFVEVTDENTSDTNATSTTDETETTSEGNNTTFTYTIFYGGGSSDFVTPYETVFAGTQYIMTSLLVNSTNTTYSSTQLQKVPDIYSEQEAQEEVTQSTRTVGLTIGILTGLAMVITSGFVMAPVLTERKLEVTQAFVRVGVRLRTYLLQWILYMGLNSILTALTLTLVAIFWKLFPQSSAGLIFGSYYMVLLQLDLMLILFSQVAPDEEVASSFSFLFFVAAAGVACAVIFGIDDASTSNLLLSITSIISPHIGIVQFSMRYAEYDIYGYGTGIFAGSNFVSSGLIGSYIGSLLGCLMYFVSIIVFATPKWSKKVHDVFGGMFGCGNKHASSLKVERANETREFGQEQQQAVTDKDSGPVIEALTRQDDVLLAIKNLQHTYFPKCCAGRDKKPTEVLKGVDMNLTRNSVLGLLGHNGCGKSTTIKILSGELELQDGSVQFNFQDGTVEWVGDDRQRQDEKRIDIDSMKRRIGVCPQHNNLLGDETCRETLRLFASLRGNLPLQPNQSIEEAIETEVNRIIQEIDFTSSEDADKPVKTYSGGMKRKVSIGIALIGDPEVVFLGKRLLKFLLMSFP